MASYLLFMVEKKLAELLQSVNLNLSTAQSNINSMVTSLREVQERLEEDPGLEMKHCKLTEWVRDMTNAAQETEDVVDNFICDLERRRRQRSGYTSAFMLTLKNLSPDNKIVEEIDQMKKKMDSITTPNEQVKQVLGFDEDLTALVKWLKEENNPHRRIMCIAGSCGAGKTALVKKIYNSPDIQERFPYRFWVICGEFNLWKKIASKVTRCSQEELEEMTVEAMCRKISSTLKGKSYLIVLDINLSNTWTTSIKHDMEKAFPDHEGSRIVLTSNHIEYASQLGEGVEVHELGLLSWEERWNLFLNNFDYDAEAAKASNESSSAVLNELKVIVREHGILPSEIVNLAALRAMEYRRGGARSNILLDHRALVEMASRFNLLEHPLKLCFLYCSLFPGGFEIPKCRIIRLWLAEGWIPKGDEDTAEKYLKELARLHMIQVQQNGLSSSVKTFCLDSLTRDFAAMKAMQCNLFHSIDHKGSFNISNARRLSLDNHISLKVSLHNHISHKDSLQNLRSLLYLSQPTEIERKLDSLEFPVSRFKLLRILDLEDMNFITKLPEELGELAHLRYLGLRHTGLNSLPKSIGSLKNLQSLDIRGTLVRPIPIAIRKLEQLQYFYMDDGSTDMDSLDVSSLKGLRVLSVIRVGRWMVNGLGKLTQLRKLGIYGDLYLDGIAENLKKLRHLKSLRLGFGFGVTIPNLNDILVSDLSLRSLYLERPLHNLGDKFPSCLAKLCLKWSLLEEDPMPTLKHLQSLEVLKLGCCSFLGKEMVCSVGGFPKLRFLEMNLLDGLEEWRVENGAMPSLKHLVIGLCNQLKMIPEVLQSLPRLKKLEVAGMPKPFNEKLQYKGVNWAKIRHIKDITVDGILVDASSSSPQPIPTAAAAASFSPQPKPMAAAAVSPPQQLSMGASSSSSQLDTEICEIGTLFYLFHPQKSC